MWIAEPKSSSDVVLFLSFLINVIVQLWREHLARRDRRNEKAEALQREQRIKDATRQQHEETRRQVNERLNSVRTRLNGLLEEEDGES